MNMVNSVAVFCGSSPGRKAIYMQEAHRMGEILAQNEIKLIYGAGTTGLMGAVADGAFSENGYVIGATIRELYDIEEPQEIVERATKFEVWDLMADRKVSMVRQADAICILPGGFGSMDELFEVLTLRQLNIIKAPIIVVNIDGFYNTLEQFIFEMIGEGFAKPYQLKLLRFVKSVDEVLPAIEEEMTLISEAETAKTESTQKEKK